MQSVQQAAGFRGLGQTENVDSKLEAAVQEVADKRGVEFQPLYDAVVALRDATHPVNACGQPRAPDANEIAGAIIHISDVLETSAVTPPVQNDGDSDPCGADHCQGGSPPAISAGSSYGSTAASPETEELEAWYEHMMALGIPPDQIAQILAQLMQNANANASADNADSGDDVSGGFGDFGGFGGFGGDDVGGGGSDGAAPSAVGSGSEFLLGGSLAKLELGVAGDTTGSQRSDPADWTKRSGRNDGAEFASGFDPGMVNGNTIAIQGDRGAEVIAGDLNPDRGMGTYFYSSKKEPADGLVQSGFLYGNNRKFEIDFDESDFGNPGDKTTQMASIYIDNNKTVEVKYKASDLGFKNFSDQTMHFKADITEGHVSVQAINSEGKWQQIAELSNGTINSGTLRETDFKPMMSTWRIAGTPDDGQRHEMTGDMSFTPS